MASVWHLSRQWWGYWALAKTAIPAQIVRVGVMMLRSVKDYEDEGKLTTAERALITAVRAGQDCALSTTRPDMATDANTIRADLLALLIIGGKDGDDLHPVGVTLVGGYISGTLTLTHRLAVGETGLFNCHFDSAPEMRGATFTVLGLDGSRLPALNAQGINVAQDLFLSGAKVTGTTRLISAKIGGQLNCQGATFDGKGGNALNLQRAEVGAALVWLDVTVTSGIVGLAATTVGDLWDDVTSWPKAHDPSLPSPQPKLILDGFTYTRLIATTTRAKDRLPWLAAGSYWEGQFTPQPYTQLAKVLREIGLAHEADIVEIERRRRIAIEARRNRSWLTKPFGWALDALLRWFVGYGYAGYRAGIWLVLLIFVAWGFAWMTWEEGSFAPNSDVILVSRGWIEVTAKDCAPFVGPCVPNPAEVWSAKHAVGMDWDSFHSIGYALDLVLPLVDLGQTNAWAPSKDRGTWGWVLWWARWPLVIIGWVLASFAAAVLVGIAQRSRD